jgi:hypothetical protein
MDSLKDESGASAVDEAPRHVREHVRRRAEPPGQVDIAIDTALATGAGVESDRAPTCRSRNSTPRTFARLSSQRPEDEHVIAVPRLGRPRRPNYRRRVSGELPVGGVDSKENVSIQRMRGKIFGRVGKGTFD